MNSQTLEQQLSGAISKDFIFSIRPHIKNNLNAKFQIRPYQEEALARFSYYVDHYPHRKRPTQLLFHMATGSGKTLVMAGCILDLYAKGYRNFIFFVNSLSIIDKTRDNFLNALSSKYLFKDPIAIADKVITIKEVSNFETASKEDVNIVFTTIQGLHSRLNTPKENSLTFEDLEDTKVVLLSDEAHHINAETKKGPKTKDEEENIISWEGTVNKIFNSNPDNYLLEFTATADLSNEEIRRKYQDKLLFNYPLKQFRKDRYSKEVQVLQAELAPFERALQAVILNQYRRKVFEENKLNIKPVILFKSRTIKDSQSFFSEFVNSIKSLSASSIHSIQINPTTPITKKAFKYFSNKGITIEHLIAELQEDFSEDKCISVDSKNDSEEKQLIINTLEEENNEYRAVFAVDKLNEGWDVLNLFDIVRLYNTRDTDHRSGKVGKTTMAEAQLIGRGARYCPFKISNEQPLYQRKYDEDIAHDLRICEELYYHAAHNPQYISELNKALEAIGIKAAKKNQKQLAQDGFKHIGLDKAGEGDTNETKLDHAGIDGLDKSIREKVYKKKFLTGYTSIRKAFGNELQMDIQKAIQTHQLGSFEIPIIRKALNKLPFYRFDNLQPYFPYLSSITEFITSDKFLNQIRVEIEGTITQAQKPDHKMKLEVAVQVLDEISSLILKKHPKKGCF